MPKEINSGVDNGRSQYQGAGIPPHESPPRATGEGREPVVPGSIEGIGQVQARLQTMRQATDESFKKGMKAVREADEEVYLIMEAFYMELGDLRFVVDSMLESQAEMHAVPKAVRLQKAIAARIDNRRTQQPKQIKAQVTEEVVAVEEAELVEEDGGDEKVEEEVEEELERPLSTAGEGQR